LNDLLFLYDSPSGFSGNPALGSSGLEISGGYLYSIRELPVSSVYINLPVWLIQLGLGYNNLLHPAYQEHLATLNFSGGYAGFRAGMNFHRLFTQVKPYYQSASYLIDLGFVWQHDHWRSGVCLRNILQGKIIDITLPSQYLMETEISIAENCRLALALEKDSGWDFTFRTGASYEIFKQLNFLASYQAWPDRMGAGLVFRLDRISAIFSLRTHNYLKITYFISLSYSFKRNE
ncbi:MAG: hypothetical protein JW784_00725, partial [Candidatus Cloacimonetes bacterium]|nr:hypothetical protein [Candidatus Cloacimonadota bacterium]